MLHPFFIYLFESSVCLLLFAAFYKLLLQKLTFFRWRRYYLIASLILAVIVPLFDIPIHTNSNLFSLYISPIQIDGAYEFQELNSNINSLHSGQNKPDLLKIVLYFVLFCYSLVALIKLIQFARKLLNIKNLITTNKKIKDQHYWIVTIEQTLPAFSFFRYIFINKNLDKDKFDIIRKHESFHVNQLHSLDNILFEILLIIFWFNPIMNLYKIYIHEIHEFIVDEQLTHKQGNKKAYSNLLLNLAAENINISPFLGFSSIQINKRINMLNKQKSKAMKKFSFILILPVITIMLLSFSISKKYSDQNVFNHEPTKIEKLIIENITWEGNTEFSNETLTKALGLEIGDEYNHDMHQRIMGDKSQILSLYMDKGYVFYYASFSHNIKDKMVDLTVKIDEHHKGVIGKIAITGNDKIVTQKILDKIIIKKGDLFNRTAIITSVNKINKMKKINSDKTDVRVLPEQGVVTKEGYSVIDLEFVITEK